MNWQAVYTLAEASVYTGIPSTTLRSWFMPRSDGGGRGPIFNSDLPRIGDEFGLSFFNLVEAFVASFFKKNLVKPNDIRKANLILKEKLHTPHPFVHAHLRTGLGHVVHDQSHGTRFQEVISKQLLFPEFSDGLHRLIYSPTTNLTDAWKVSPGVVIRPETGFGKPVLDIAGVSTLIVAKQYVANGKNAALVARLFKITEAGVNTAYQFEKNLRRIAA